MNIDEFERQLMLLMLEEKKLMPKEKEGNNAVTAAMQTVNRVPHWPINPTESPTSFLWTAGNEILVGLDNNTAVVVVIKVNGKDMSVLTLYGTGHRVAREHCWHFSIRDATGKILAISSHFQCVCTNPNGRRLNVQVLIMGFGREMGS